MTNTVCHPYSVVPMPAASVLCCACVITQHQVKVYSHILIGIQNNQVSYAAHNRSKLLFLGTA